MMNKQAAVTIKNINLQIILIEAMDQFETHFMMTHHHDINYRPPISTKYWEIIWISIAPLPNPCKYSDNLPREAEVVKFITTS